MLLYPEESSPMENKMQGSLTGGPILRVLTKLALPIMASSFLSTAYNITDMAWIGQLGSKAVVGVGIGGMFIWLSQGLASMARMGGQVYMAQSLGSGDRDSARGYAHAAIHLAVLFGLLYGLIALLFARPLVSFFNLDDPQSIASAEIYLRITCGLIVFSYLNAVLTGLFTAQGDSTTPLKANFIGLAINMVFDPLLILGFGPFPRLEVIGAAVATVSAQVVVTLVLLLSIHRRKNNQGVLHEVPLTKPSNAACMLSIIRLGGPTALQGSLYCMISMVLTRMVAGFGDAAAAAQRVGGQIESISWNSADGFAAALNAFVGQNFGAGKMDRVKKGYNISAVTVLVWGTAVMLLFLLFTDPITRIFFHEAEVIPISNSYLRIIGFSEPLLCVEIIAIAAISALGNTKLCSIISIICTGMRIPLAHLLSRTALGLNGIWWAFTLTSMVKGVILHFAFRRECRHKEIRKAAE